jgi:regulatory protein
LRRKLRDRGAGAAEIEVVLEHLQSDGWIDDRRFVENYVRARARRGFGPLKISHELRLRGIEVEPPAEVPEEVAADWIEAAELARRKRFGKAAPANPRERGRQARFLENRGFSGEQIHRVLRAMEE